MNTSTQIRWLLTAGILLMVVALLLQTVTIVSQQYGDVLVASLVLTMIADCCFITAFVRGNLVVRCVSVVLMLPTVFVVADFVRRAPHSLS